MRKIYFLIIVLISFQSFSQKDYTRYYNSWRLGLNLGGAWQTADYRSCWGMAGGFTLEKGFHENNTNIFSFAIRGRYLAANTYGMDFSRNYNVKSNDAYNGQYDTRVNFLDSVPTNRQYVYDNYRMQLSEGSLELQITFNRLRERTNVLLNLWGGVGVTSYRTKSDLLDGKGKMYDFSKVDSAGSQAQTISSYNALIDKNYESYALGSKNGDLITFSPSAGIGLGYQFSPGFSMLWEYKVTFPLGTNADLLDGKIGANTDMIAGSNDYYHYTGVNFVFTLRGKHKNQSNPPRDETVYTNTVVTTNPGATNPITNTIVTTQTVVANNPVDGLPQRPLITFVNPPISGQIVNNQQYNIAAQILNINNSNQIQFKFNGATYTNYSYNAQTNLLEYPAGLNSGTNTIQIIATNTAGSDNESTTIVYELPKPAGNPPVVSYINPIQPALTVTASAYNVKAQVLNVSGQNGISVYYNGMSTAFNYNPTTKQVTFLANLNPGSNSISITANNTVGEDTKSTNIVYRDSKMVGIPPVVNLINPSNSSNSTNTGLYNFKLSVLNVTSKNDITTTFNGISTSVFNYDINSKTFDFSGNLNLGSNTLVVNAANAFGSDSKTITVTYSAPTKVKLPPVVTITNPSTNPGLSSFADYTFKANVTNITSKSQLVVKINGVAVSNYSLTNTIINCPAVLVNGNNIFEVIASNTEGSDSKSSIVVYKQKTFGVPPVVSLIDPTTINNTSNTHKYFYKLSVVNVSNQSDIELLFNGIVQTNFSYDATTKELFYQGFLVTGFNTLVVKATNQFGTDSKTINVNYTKPVDVKTPPTVVITNPASSPASSSVASYLFKANVTNISSKSQLVVKLNGALVSNFILTNGLVICNTTLVNGNNIFEITATNNDGSDAKTSIVVYKPKGISIPPVVSLINPQFEMNASDDAFYVFKLSVLNVNGKSDIELLFNGVAQSNFTYDINTKEVVFETTLVSGDNTVSVKGTNQIGSDSKTIHVNYTPHVALLLPPFVTFINPASSGTISQNVNYVYKASITNMPNTSGLQVKYNSNVISNYSYDGSNLSFPANLNIGPNTLEIKTTNNDGSDIKSGTVIYRPKIVAKPPVLTIIQPVGTPTVSTRLYDFQFKALNVTQNQIEIKLNGDLVTQFTFANSMGSFNGNIERGINSIVIKATNQDGSVTKSETIVLSEDLGSPTSSVTPTDTTGSSGASSTGQKTTVICHGASDPNATPQTMTVPMTQLFMHLGHGDTKGECPAVKVNPIKVNPRPNLNKPAGETKPEIKSDTPIKTRPNLNKPANENKTEVKSDTLRKQPINSPRRPR